jgi:predicted cupin superfamily sugar epimerase
VLTTVREDDVQRLVRKLDLAPHPEGGFYRETVRTSWCTNIYFLLPGGQFSAWHRVRNADEVWHHYAGDPLVLHLLGDRGLERMVLGDPVHHLVVPAGTWQTAAPASQQGYVLVGCTVAPPFELQQFELADRAALSARHPEHERLIARYCR